MLFLVISCVLIYEWVPDEFAMKKKRSQPQKVENPWITNWVNLRQTRYDVRESHHCESIRFFHTPPPILDGINLLTKVALLIIYISESLHV